MHLGLFNKQKKIFLFFIFSFSFSTVLQSGELGPVLVQFNFPEDVTKAANQGDLQAFAQALEKYYKTSNDKINEKKSSDNTMDTS